MRQTDCEVAIIGGGPGGLAAGIFAARSRRKTVIFEQLMPGGQMTLTDLIENYPNGVSHYEWHYDNIFVFEDECLS